MTNTENNISQWHIVILECLRSDIMVTPVKIRQCRCRWPNLFAAAQPAQELATSQLHG